MAKKADAGVIERRAYYRAGRAANRDRVKQYNRSYWQRRAQKRQEASTTKSITSPTSVIRAD